MIEARIIILLCVGLPFMATSAIAQSSSDPCDTAYILQEIGGFKDLKANRPSALPRSYRAYKNCISARSSTAEKELLFELGVAYLHQQKPFDTTEYRWLNGQAKSFQNSNAEGLLELTFARVQDMPADVRHQQFLKALDIVRSAPTPNKETEALLHCELGRGCLMNGFEGDWHTHFTQAKIYFTEHEQYRRLINLYWRSAQFLVFANGDRSLAQAWLDTARTLAEVRDPTSIPSVLGAWVSVGPRDPTTKTAFQIEAAEICFKQAELKEEVCEACSGIVGDMISGSINGYIDPNLTQGYIDRYFLLIDKNDPLEMAKFFQVQAMHQMSRGNCKKAYTYIRWAEEALQKSHSWHVRVWGVFFDTKNTIINCIGDVEEARSNARDAYDFFLSQQGFEQHAHRVYGNLAGVLVSNGHLQEALDLYESDTLHFADNDLTAYWFKGDLYTELGDLSSARQFYELAMPKAPTKELKARILEKIAAIDLEQGYLARAQAYLDTAFILYRTHQVNLSRQKELPSVSERYNTVMDVLLTTQAELFLARSELRDKEAYIDSSLTSADAAEVHLNFLVTCGVDPSALQPRYKRIQALRLEALLTTNKQDATRFDEVLLSTIASMQSRSLQMELLQNRYTRNAGLLEFDSLNRAVNAKAQAFEDGKFDEVNSTLSAQKVLAEEIHQVEMLRERILREALPVLADTAVLSLERLTSWCKRENAMILSFLLGTDNCYALLVDKNGCDHLKTYLSSDSLTPMIAKAAAIIGGDQGQEDNGMLALIVDKLIPKNLWASSTNHLIILPDGPLNSLPFEALPLPGSNKEGELLSDRFNISYSFSIKHSMREPARSDKQGLLAVAPSYSEQSIDTASTPNRSRWLFTRSAKIKKACTSLPGSAAEASFAVELFNGLALIGAKATERNFTDALNAHGVVLINAHGFTYDVDPLLSGLVFTDAFGALPQDTAVTFDPVFFQNDGILHAFEIQDMNLDLDLVILSTCHSGTGKYQEGEGTMSLARAFMMAGARSVVMSLWQVENESTTEITTAFLENLSDGMRKSEALNLAKKAYRKAHPTAPSYYWAGLVLVGNDDPLPIPTSRSLWWRTVPIALLIGGILFWRSRRKSRVLRHAA
jgi:CHAT domain-containing protein